MTDLGTLGGTQTTPTGINSSGAVTGVSTPAIQGVGLAFTWSPPNGPIQSLGFLPGGVSSDGLSINDSGWIVGEAGASEAFLYTPKGGMTPLGFLALGTVSQGVLRERRRDHRRGFDNRRLTLRESFSLDGVRWNG